MASSKNKKGYRVKSKTDPKNEGTQRKFLSDYMKTPAYRRRMANLFPKDYTNEFHEERQGAIEKDKPVQATPLPWQKRTEGAKDEISYLVDGQYVFDDDNIRLNKESKNEGVYLHELTHKTQKQLTPSAIKGTDFDKKLKSILPHYKNVKGGNYSENLNEMRARQMEIRHVLQKERGINPEDEVTDEDVEWPLKERKNQQYHQEVINEMFLKDNPEPKWMIDDGEGGKIVNPAWRKWTNKRGDYLNKMGEGGLVKPTTDIYFEPEITEPTTGYSDGQTKELKKEEIKWLLNNIASVPTTNNNSKNFS